MFEALNVSNSIINRRKRLTLVEVSSLYDVGKFLQELCGLPLKRRIHGARTEGRRDMRPSLKLTFSYGLY